MGKKLIFSNERFTQKLIRNCCRTCLLLSRRGTFPWQMSPNGWKIYLRLLRVSELKNILLGKALSWEEHTCCKC